MSMLIVERGKGSGARIPLVEFPITLGRDPGNSVVVDDQEASRYHVRIKKRGRLHIIEDLESRNGTYVNGDRIVNAVLRSGDKLLIGATEFQFVTAESDIHITTAVLNISTTLSDELGLQEPITMARREDYAGFTPIRLSQQNVSNKLNFDSKAIKEIFDLHSNILVIDDLEEAAATLLKSLGRIMPYLSRAVCFVWTDSHRQLLPCASRHFRKKKLNFSLSRRALEDVIARRQGLLLMANSPEVTQSGCSRLVIPMQHNSQLACVIHLEIDDVTAKFEDVHIELMQALLNRCAPCFETLLLRREIDGWMVGMIESMIATIEAKDTYTLGHSERVSRYSMAIADQLKLNREVKRLLLVSAICHDIGKIGIPDSILKKASILSAEEYDEMKLHPTIGAEIIRHMPNSHRFISGVKHHHEKWDGTGYPDGLAGEDIPFFGRIVAIADVFDAMVSGRSYSGFMDQTEAVEKLQEEQDLFDPEILKSFVKAYEKGTLTLKTSTASQNPAEDAKADSTFQKVANSVNLAEEDKPKLTRIPKKIK